MNRQGLSRTIPSNVQREVRRRSKFGCVICRDGFCTYEHIADFVTVDQHDPALICLLCESCHGRITRGQWSKDIARTAYETIQQRSPEEAGLPRGPLDFHTGTAELAMGDLLYAPAVETALRYFGQDLIKLAPGKNGDPGMISAIFTDDQGAPILKLEENSWVGSLDAWDIDVEGQRITVRKKVGVIALRLRLEPPGRIVVERLDMRIGSHHILVSEHGYAVGAYVGENDVMWVSPQLTVQKAMPQAAAIEITEPQKLRDREQYFQLVGKGVGMTTSDGFFVMHSPAGVMAPSLGISIASWCSFGCYGAALGKRPLSGMREAVFFKPAERMRAYMAGIDD